jgi:hypothetical protein
VVGLGLVGVGTREENHCFVELGERPTYPAIMEAPLVLACPLASR